MAYIDAFVLPVKTARRDDYVKECVKFEAVMKEMGATRVVEWWGGDVPAGVVTSFPLAVKLEADETVAIGMVEWPDKATRDAGNEKSRNDPRMAMPKDPPFDGKRMIYGGFTPLR
jgi:uncharacterized protein YbaA (DUF1428 family)